MTSSTHFAMRLISLLLIFTDGVESFSPFRSTRCPLRTRSKSAPMSQLQLSQDPDKQSFQEKLDKILDTQFFDPEKVFEAESPEVKENPEKSFNPLVWFANLVQNDYETAEAIFAAGFISFMVVISQEMLRFAKFGDAYQPFQSSSVSGGSLF